MLVHSSVKNFKVLSEVPTGKELKNILMVLLILGLEACEPGGDVLVCQNPDPGDIQKNYVL